MENVSNELTSRLHLTQRDTVKSPSGILQEYIASLSEEDRAVLREIENSDGSKAMVVIHRGENKGARFLISDQASTIGRSSESSIFLDDVTVSRKHAVIEQTGAGYLLRDGGSLNGSYVNSALVAEITLNSGDEIQIGKFHLLFVSGQVKKD